MTENHVRGLRLFEAGRVRESVAFFAKALEDGESSELWNDWAAAVQACGHIDQAERGYLRALNIDPRNYQALANYGVLLARSNRPGEAISFLTRSFSGIDEAQRPAVEELLRACRNSVEAAGKVREVSPAHESASAAEPAVLAYYGHHQCGSTWIRLVMAGACQLAGLNIAHHRDDCAFEGDILKFRRQHPFDLWLYTNADYTFVRPLNTVGFHVVRDPRDVVVSGYFSHLNDHPGEHQPRLRLFQSYLQSLSKEEGLLKEMEFSIAFLQHMLSWDYGVRPSIMELKLEHMIASPLDSFQGVLEHLGITPDHVSRETLASILEKHSLHAIGRATGHEDASGHFGPGDWRNHFTREHIAYFKSLYNQTLLKLGYEIGEDWH